MSTQTVAKMEKNPSQKEDRLLVVFFLFFFFLFFPPFFLSFTMNVSNLEGFLWVAELLSKAGDASLELGGESSVPQLLIPDLWDAPLVLTGKEVSGVLCESTECRI